MEGWKERRKEGWKVGSICGYMSGWVDGESVLLDVLRCDDEKPDECISDKVKDEDDNIELLLL